MTLQELRYLVALADKGHFVRAAEACHVGQSTLSRRYLGLKYSHYRFLVEQYCAA